jgi:hypothetical protein
MKQIVALIVPCLFASIGLAAEPKDDFITKTYPVADLLYQPGGKTSGFDSIDEIIQTVIREVNPKSWLRNPEGGNRLFEVNGIKLEVRATKNDHDEIENLLEALRRLSDLAVDVKTTFLSVDAKWYDKEIRERLKKLRIPLMDDDEAGWKEHGELLELVQKNSEVIQSGKVRQGNSRTNTIASMRQAHSIPKPQPGENGEPVWDVEYTGITYRAQVVVSVDRRFVKLKITETRRELEGQRIVEKKIETEITMPDGGTQLLVVPYKPKSIAEGGRTMLLRIEPRIYIEAEEKELRGKKGDG